MKLMVVDPTKAGLHQAFGITEQRSDELSNICQKCTDKALRNPTAVPWAGLLADIAEYCNTNEELVYCVTNNMNYLIYKGYMSATPKKFTERNLNM